MTEIWKTYLEGCYEASSEGRVRSIDKQVLFNGTPGIRKGIVMKLTKNAKGYLTVVICDKGQRATKSVHQVIAGAFLENPDGLPHINHKDGNKLNNAVTNLEWVSASANQQHAYDTGLKGKGAAHGRAKLVEADVYSIKQRQAAGELDGTICKDYSVTEATLRNIRIGANWKDVII